MLDDPWLRWPNDLRCFILWSIWFQCQALRILQDFPLSKISSCFIQFCPNIYYKENSRSCFETIYGPGSNLLERIDVEVWHPDFLGVVEVNRSTKVGFDGNQLVLVTKVMACWSNPGAPPASGGCFYLIPTFQLIMNSMLRVMQELTKSRSIISVITRSKKTWSS